jgi:tRNA(His) guanylyltransferase
MNLGDRFKRYEAVNKTLLPLNSYVIVRIDGRCFKTYTKGFEKPFDQKIMDTMDHVTKQLCINMQNVVLGYVQSDEISILMYDGNNVESQPWFNNEVEKIVSISASIATASFNQYMMLRKLYEMGGNCDLLDFEILLKSKQAEFDSRVFVLPNVDEVVNYILWRYRDWVRNSINTVGQKYFSAKQLHKKSTDEVQEMLFQEKGINWNNYSVREKRGGLCYKTENGWQMIEMPHVVCNEENEFYKLIK